MDKLISMSSEQLDKLRDTFTAHGGSLDLQQFVGTMIQVLDRKHYDTHEKAINLVQELTSLFADSDIDGNGDLEWDELNIYFSSIGETNSKQRPQKRIAFLKRPGFPTNTLHRLCIKKVKYVPELCKLVVIEHGSQCARIFNTAVIDLNGGYPLTCVLNTNETGRERNADFADCTYIPEYELLAFTMDDFSLCLYDAIMLKPEYRYFDMLAVLELQNRELVHEGLAEPTSSLDPAMLVSENAATIENLTNSPLQGLRPKMLGWSHASTPQRLIVWSSYKKEVMTVGVEPVIHRWKIHAKMGKWKTRNFELELIEIFTTVHSATISSICVISQYHPLIEMILANENKRVTAVSSWLGEHLRSEHAKRLLEGKGERLADLVATTSTDAKLCLWRWNTGKLDLLTCKTNHKKSIWHVVHVPSENMLLTAGHDHWIQAWDIESLDCGLLFRLEGHTVPICGLSAIPAKGEAVSVDEEGVVKWWNCSKSASDVEQSRCLQTFTMTSSLAGKLNHGFVRGLVVIPSISIMAAWSTTKALHRVPLDSKVSPYTSEKTTEQIFIGPMGERLSSKGGVAASGGNEEMDNINLNVCQRHVGTYGAAALTSGMLSSGICSLLVACPRFNCFELTRTTQEDTDSLDVQYSSATLEIYQAAGSNLHVYDASTGRHKKTLRNLTDGAKITCMCLDSIGRKLFVGDSKGHTTLVNLITGSAILQLPPHSFGSKQIADVSHIHSNSKDRIILTSGADGTVRIFDETAQINETFLDRKTSENASRLGRANTREIKYRYIPSAFFRTVTRFANIDRSHGYQSSYASQGKIKSLKETEKETEQLKWRIGTLREIRGTHGKDEITCIEYNRFMGMIATACSNGSIKTWSFEYGRHYGTSTDHTCTISALAFLTHWPALVSGDIEGKVSVLDVRRNMDKSITPLLVFNVDSLYCNVVDRGGAPLEKEREQSVFRRRSSAKKSLAHRSHSTDKITNLANVGTKHTECIIQHQGKASKTSEIARDASFLVATEQGIAAVVSIGHIFREMDFPRLGKIHSCFEHENFHPNRREINDHADQNNQHLSLASATKRRINEKSKVPAHWVAGAGIQILTTFSLKIEEDNEFLLVRSCRLVVTTVQPVLLTTDSRCALSIWDLITKKLVGWIDPRNLPAEREIRSHWKFPLPDDSKNLRKSADALWKRINQDVSQHSEDSDDDSLPSSLHETPPDYKKIPGEYELSHRASEYMRSLSFVSNTIPEPHEPYLESTSPTSTFEKLSSFHKTNAFLERHAKAQSSIKKPGCFSPLRSADRKSKHSDTTRLLTPKSNNSSLFNLRTARESVQDSAQSTARNDASVTETPRTIFPELRCSADKQPRSPSELKEFVDSVLKHHLGSGRHIRPKPKKVQNSAVRRTEMIPSKKYVSLKGDHLKHFAQHAATKDSEVRREVQKKHKKKLNTIQTNDQNAKDSLDGGTLDKRYDLNTAKEIMPTLAEEEQHTRQGLQKIRKAVMQGEEPDPNIYNEDEGSKQLRKAHELLARQRFGMYLKHDVDIIKQLFLELDPSGRGVISLADFSDSARVISSNIQSHLGSIFRSVDRSGNGEVTYSELMPVLFPNADFSTQRDIEAYLKLEKTELVDLSELKEQTWDDRELEEYKTMFQVFDRDGTGDVSYQNICDTLQEIDKKSSRKFHEGTVAEYYEQAQKQHAKQKILQDRRNSQSAVRETIQRQSTSRRNSICSSTTSVKQIDATTDLARPLCFTEFLEMFGTSSKTTNCETHLVRGAIIEERKRKTDRFARDTFSRSMQ